MARRMIIVLTLLAATARVRAGRLSLATHAGSMGPPGSIQMDILWTMLPTDTSTVSMTGLDLRFNITYPAGNQGSLTVSEVSTLPNWFSYTEGLGDTFTEAFFLGVGDITVGDFGIDGAGTEFTTVAASVVLVPTGNVGGTEITFRHNNPQDPLPAAYDGPRNWQLRWQGEVTGPLQFDIGVGNPGDAGGNWTTHGYETYQPLVIPEPASLTLLALATVTLGALLRQRP